MKGYTFDLGCPFCGEACEHLTGTVRAGTEAVAVARCTGCGRQWSVQVLLRPINAA